MSQRNTVLTCEQRLKLADGIRQYIEHHFPGDEFSGQEEALVIALIAMTSFDYAKTLLSTPR